MGTFGYYAEYSPVLRPPSSVAASSVSTAVRTAPWNRWVNQGKPLPAQATSASSQTGSSLISKGGAETSPAANVLQNIQSNTQAAPAKCLPQEEAPSLVSLGSQRRPLSMEICSLKQLEASPVAAVTENIAPDSNIAATKEIPQEAAKEIPSMQKESLQPKVAK